MVFSAQATFATATKKNKIKKKKAGKKGVRHSKICSIVGLVMSPAEKFLPGNLQLIRKTILKCKCSEFIFKDSPPREQTIFSFNHGIPNI